MTYGGSTMNGPGIALQLFTLREPAKKNLADTLRRARDTGFEYVQWSGMPDLPAAEIRAALDAAGLKAVAGHISVEAFEQDFKGALEHWTAIGVTDLAVGSMMADNRDTLEAWRRGAVRLDRLGARLREHGIRFSYHNHDFEFAPFEEDGDLRLDILFSETNPRHLYCEIDTAWVQVGGQSPGAYLRKYSGRCPVIHVKDLAADSAPGRVRFTELGRGVLDWPDVFRAAREAGVEWYVYEQDTCEGDPIESARASYAFLREHLS